MIHGKSNKAIRLGKVEIYDYNSDEVQPSKNAEITFRHRAYTYPLILDKQSVGKSDSGTVDKKC